MKSVINYQPEEILSKNQNFQQNILTYQSRTEISMKNWAWDAYVSGEEFSEKIAHKSTNNRQFIQKLSINEQIF